MKGRLSLLLAVAARVWQCVRIRAQADTSDLRYLRVFARQR
jgi:hypothetical protein